MILNPDPSRQRSAAMIADRKRWFYYAFLPLVRQSGSKAFDVGVMYDAWGVSNRTGFSATVFAQNPLRLPKTEAELLAGPREVWDNLDELLDAGWRVD